MALHYDAMGDDEMTATALQAFFGFRLLFSSFFLLVLSLSPKCGTYIHHNMVRTVPSPLCTVL